MKGWKETEWGDEFTVDLPAGPGFRQGLLSFYYCQERDESGQAAACNEKRLISSANSSLRAIPVAAICHGPWTLIDAGAVRGRKMTSYHSIQMDLKNAGQIGWIRKW